MRSLVAAFAAVAALPALVGASCGDDVTPAQAVAASRDAFRQLDSFRASTRISSGQDAEFQFEGEVAFQSGVLVYQMGSYGGESPGQEGDTQLLVIPDDLYMRIPEGDWFVLSPWSQGVRPDEIPEAGLSDQFIARYDEIADALYAIRRLPDDAVGDQSHRHYSGLIDVNRFPSAEMPDSRDSGDSVGVEGSLEVELWLDKETYAPRQMRVTASDESGTWLDVTVVYFDLDLPVKPPEPPANARPWRDLQLPEAPCTGSLYAACLPPQTELASIASDSCAGSERRVCVAPLGQVSPDMIHHLVDHYRQMYGLDVTILTPSGIPEQITNPLREQIDAASLISYMRSLFREAFDDPEAVLIGLTSVDLYGEDSHFRYLFGWKGDYTRPHAVVSTFRMDPRTYGESADDQILHARVRKMFSRYVGLLYFGLPTSPDPSSPLYDSILGVSDLDNMGEPLPVPTTG